MHIYKVTENCIRCGACVEDCPAQAIYFSAKLPTINQQKCTHCGDCYEICPTGAIIKKLRLKDQAAGYGQK